MNSGITFIEGLNGIEPSEAALSYPWVTGVTAQTRFIEELKEDNFFAMDVESISSTIDTLNSVEQIVESTNLYYQLDPSKQQLMSEIIEEMTLLKTAKTSLDSSIIKNAITQFNDNLEVAQKQYYRKYLRDLCEQYNNSGDNRLKYAIWVFDQQTGFERRIELGYFERDRWVSVNGSIKSTETIIPSMTEYDYISYNGLLGSDSQETFGGILSFLKGIDQSNEEMKKELSKRGIGYITLYPRPEDTR